MTTLLLLLAEQPKSSVDEVQERRAEGKEFT
jgi:hypothetical protein